MLFPKENSDEIHSCLNEVEKIFQIWATSSANLSGYKRKVKIISSSVAANKGWCFRTGQSHWDKYVVMTFGRYKYTSVI